MFEEQKEGPMAEPGAGAPWIGEWRAGRTGSSARLRGGRGVGLGRPCRFTAGENAGGLVRVVAAQLKRRGCVLGSVIPCLSFWPLWVLVSTVSP